MKINYKFKVIQKMSKDKLSFKMELFRIVKRKKKLPRINNNLLLKISSQIQINKINYKIKLKFDVIFIFYIQFFY